MDEILQYEIHYTPSAIQDMLDKADYIAYALKSPETALTWYRELRQDIRQDLATFPYKYPIYHVYHRCRGKDSDGSHGLHQREELI